MRCQIDLSGNSLSNTLMGLVTSWRTESPNPHRCVYYSRIIPKIVVAEVAFALIAVIALVETVVSALWTAITTAFLCCNPSLFKNSAKWLQMSSFVSAWVIADLFFNFYPDELFSTPQEACEFVFPGSVAKKETALSAYDSSYRPPHTSYTPLQQPYTPLHQAILPTYTPLRQAIRPTYTPLRQAIRPTLPQELLALPPCHHVQHDPQLLIQLEQEMKAGFDRAAALHLISIATVAELPHVREALHWWATDEELNKDYNKHLLMADLFIHFIEQIKKIKFEASPQNATAIAVELLNRLTPVYFHGTHIRHYETIRREGLVATKAVRNEQADRINKIFNETLGHNHGQLGLRYTNCITEKGAFVFVASQANTTINYAIHAPEWFSLFAGQKMYVARNYQQAISDLNESIAIWKTARPNSPRPMTEREGQDVRDFFETTWRDHQEQRPVVFKAIVPSQKQPMTAERFKELVGSFNPGSFDLSSPQAVHKIVLQIHVSSHFNAINVPLSQVPHTHLSPFFIPYP
jgi:hypothetical protein